MRCAVTVQGNGFNVGTAGMVLMVVGAIGAVLSIVYWASWGGFGRHTRVIQSPETAVEPRRTVVSEREIPQH